MQFIEYDLSMILLIKSEILSNGMNYIVYTCIFLMLIYGFCKLVWMQLWHPQTNRNIFYFLNKLEVFSCSKVPFSSCFFA